MQWVELPRYFPDQPVLGSHTNTFTYIITTDRDPATEDNRYAASAKPRGTEAFAPGRVELGIFDSFTLAEQACRNHAKRAQQ